MSTSIGVISAGHELTVEAGEEILQAGGNAYDAALAAMAVACVAEPVLTSMAGGGFMLARPAGSESFIYDFFVQTPGEKKPREDIDFYGIMADFGSTQQEFHIGMASVAVPGQVQGMFEIHKDLCTMPMTEIFAPAIRFAREGVVINEFQAFLFTVVQAIYLTEDLRAIFESQKEQGKLVLEGEVVKQPDLANFFEALAIEGPDLFYRGEVAEAIAMDMKVGGLVTKTDLESYQVVKRKPLRMTYRDVQIEMNPPPSSGGLLAALGLKLLEGTGFEALKPGGEQHLMQLASVLDKTLEARVALEALDYKDREETVFDEGFLSQYREGVVGVPKATQGTTHINVIDKDGNMASVTVSNGQGSNYVIPGTGVIMNNMMGEADLNPGGFQAWAPDSRMTSMMIPATLFWPDGRRVALGSGGSNRIRTTILQVVLNLVAFEMSVPEAIDLPRIHMEEDMLFVEGGFSADLSQLLEAYPNHACFEDHNLFFGGAHVAEFHEGVFSGAGDPRRAGVCNL